MTNPFEIKEFYIQESTYSEKCSNTNSVSHITSINTNYGLLSGNLPYSFQMPAMNIIEIQKYLLEETTKLVLNIKLAKECDRGGLSMNTDSKLQLPPLCASTFQNFSNQQIENIRNGIILGNMKYTTWLQSGDSAFNNYAYTNEYIKSKTNPNDWKPLCQRYADIGQLLKDFSKILSKIEASTQGQYSDQYQEILQMYQQNVDTRKTLETRLDKLNTGAQYRDIKTQLDSTIYISVLWTILATVTVFYIFKKM
jgi:hypothetical protein